MEYRYRIGQDTEQEIKRIVKGRYDASSQAFRDPKTNTDNAIHQMRKNMKKARAAFRLVRPTIGNERYHQENEKARDIARLGADLRESTVRIETLDKLKERFEKEIDDDIYFDLRKKLDQQHENLIKEQIMLKNILDPILRNLYAAGGKLETLFCQQNGFDAFRKGLKKVYKRGLKAKNRAQEEASFENHHEWRKRVKYLWYQLRILKNIWPKGLDGYIKELHKLSDYLGDDHDLLDLKDELRGFAEKEKRKKEISYLEDLIHQFSQEKRNQAWPLGNKLYAEKPTDFINRIEQYWTVAHSENTSG